MTIWILLALGGFLLLIIGMLIFWKKQANLQNTPKSAYIISIMLPLIFAFIYAQDLIKDFFPGLTLLDFGVFYFLGVISGFFLALYLQRYKITPVSK